MTRAPVLLSVALLIGCGPDDDTAPAAAFDSEGWIDTSPPSPPGPRPGVESDEEGEGDDEDEDEGEGAYWGIFAVAEGSAVEEASGEFFATEAGEEVCLLLFEAVASEPETPCADCSQAWTFTARAPEVEIDVDGACERLAPADLEGTRFQVGYAGDTLFRNDGDGWRASGSFAVEGEELWMEWDAHEED